MVRSFTAGVIQLETGQFRFSAILSRGERREGRGQSTQCTHIGPADPKVSFYSSVGGSRVCLVTSTMEISKEQGGL